ncbi:MAG: T9SS type A sorting domain-containing protein [Flavobacteriales bacterium]
MLYFKNTLFALLFSYGLYAQVVTGEQITFNDSFEGFQQANVPPNHWNNCNDGSTTDTQPGAFGVNQLASHGKTYISLVTREVSQPGTAETVWAKLVKPLQKDSCLTFGIDLCVSNEFRAAVNGSNVQFNNPCRLRVWGFNNSCENKDEFELLWESDIISHFNWRTYNIECKPKNGTVTKIAFQAWFIDTLNIKNGALMLDNMRQIPVEITYVDDQLIVPEGSTNIQWYYNGNPIIDADTTNLIPFRDGFYQVFYSDPDGCRRFTRSTFIKKPSTEMQIWPNPSDGSGQIYLFNTIQGRKFFELVIYDAAGRLVYKEMINLTYGSNKIDFDFRRFAGGIYHAVIDNPEFTDRVSARFVIQK